LRVFRDGPTLSQVWNKRPCFPEDADVTDRSPSKLVPFLLAAGAVVVAGVQPLLFARLGPGAQPWNLSVIGAVGIFAAARLGFLPALAFTGLAVAAKDAAFYFTTGFHPVWESWPLFIGYAVLGFLFLRRTRSPLAVGEAALSGSIYFFVVSNFICWLTMYEKTLSGFTMCYVNSIPFFRGTLAGDLVYTGLLFGADALLSRATEPRVESVAVPVDDPR
jgi:hypothetical protein